MDNSNDQSNPVSDRLNMETMINKYVGDLEKLRENLKAQKEMFEDAFNNDPVYAEQAEKVKAETRKKTEIKQKMVKQPALAQLQEKLNGIKSEIKDTQEALSDHLNRYFRETGVNQIVGDDGDVREIVIVTKLVKKNSKYKP